MDEKQVNMNEDNNIGGDTPCAETLETHPKDNTNILSTSTYSMDIDTPATLDTEADTPTEAEKLTAEANSVAAEADCVAAEAGSEVVSSETNSSGDNTQLASPQSPTEEEVPEPSTSPPELVDIKIIYNKKKFDHSINLNSTILDLKRDIEKLTGVPIATQKVMFKGSTQDDQTLRQLKVSKSSNKFMVIGSTMNDLLKVTAPDLKSLAADKDEASAASSSKEPFCKQTVHKKVLDKYGKPEDILPGKKGVHLPLPLDPISGMYNKLGGKTRLTFKLDSDEVWIGTKAKTQKVKMSSIKDVTSQPIEGHDEYHIMGIQLGPTTASRYWIYWIPAQYVNAIKDTILGKWGDF